MSTYYVRVPICGYAEIEVEAENVKEAEEKALEGIEAKHLASWEAHREICRGNVFYGELNRIEAVEDGQ